MVNNGVSTGNFSLVQKILHVCRHTHVRSHMPLGMDCPLIKHLPNYEKIMNKGTIDVYSILLSINVNFITLYSGTVTTLYSLFLFAIT